MQGELNFQKHKSHTGPNLAYKLDVPFPVTLFLCFFLSSFLKMLSEKAVFNNVNPT